MQNKSRFTSSSNPSDHQGQQSLKQSFQSRLKAALSFMIHRPQKSVQPTSRDAYAAKARLYTYLPVSEEQRDWLERIYKSQ
ncbi:MAG: hypothetical protein HC800_22835 [Phormidesmis sp. RL_2_1]|nr:hypothetical protein [Phormidesmis sp. RL_2_1]